MKITDPSVIKNGEKDLIESLKEDLDLDAVREIIKKKMSTAALSPKGGEIVVYKNQIAFRMDFELCLSGSLMFDRQGNHILTESDGFDDPEEDPREKDAGNQLGTDRDKDKNIKTEDKMDLDLPDYDLDPLDPLDGLGDLDELTADDPEPESDIKEDDALIIDDLADDDITDILKESRDFWEKKKDE